MILYLILGWIVSYLLLFVMVELINKKTGRQTATVTSYLIPLIFPPLTLIGMIIIYLALPKRDV